MPPSPSLRGNSRGDVHKRGRSLESGLSFREKDDDLALFNELQSKEKGNFLIDSTDDFEDLLCSRTKPFPELKLGIGFSTLGESSDLLNTDGDKNDYEWLLTPPDTPLFPSLDDEPAPFNLVHNGRARSRPISISRSSMMERSHRSSRGSPSPQRSSPSPRSGSGSFPGGSSSAPHSNPVSLHSNSPSRRPSPPQAKPSTPPSRSLTPTSRRNSAGLSGIRGTSPVRSNRGNSSSPKVKAWQSNLPGFSLEVPPNLKTSLVDRSASYIRGSSPASKSSRDPSLKYGRKSMSPSRSMSSSHSQDDDDDRPIAKKGVDGYSSGRPLGFSKKVTKTFSSSSAPKRSFDSAIRQMDRTTPPNMFRPLLSSVPSSTFSATIHCTRNNSSITTSCNTSTSDLATNTALDTGSSVLYNDDMASDCARATFSDTHDEVFAFDKIDGQLVDHGQHETQNPIDSVKSAVDGNTLICSICSSCYHPDELAENEDDNNKNICSECKQKVQLRDFSEIPVGPPETPLHESQPSQIFPEKSLSASSEVENKDYPSRTDTNMDVTESGGISVLLKRSNSEKGHIVHGRTINSSAISFEDLSYARETSSLRSSTGHGNFSASSSVDLTANRHVEMCIRRQLSCRLSESSSKPQSTVSSFSGNLIPVNRSFGHSTSSHEGSSERPTSPLDQVVALPNAELSVLAVSESSVGEEGIRSDDRVREVDVGECCLSTMSEIEINDSHPSSPKSQIDVGVKEDLEGNSAVMDHCVDINDASFAPDHADIVVEESTVTMEENGGRRTKSLTLEEATDAILFCNSIIHSLAYNAANIAIEKEKENLEPPLEELSTSTVTIPDKPTTNPRGYTTGRTQKPQKARKRRTSEPEEKQKPASPTQTSDKPNEPVVRNVGLPKNSDSWKPPKLESKCNCTVM